MEPRTRQLPLDPRHRVFAAAGHVLPHEGAASPGALGGRSRPERADALLRPPGDRPDLPPATLRRALPLLVRLRDRKSTRLNSSHVRISYAVFCLKKKNKWSDIKSSLRNNIHLQLELQSSMHLLM